MSMSLAENIPGDKPPSTFAIVVMTIVTVAIIIGSAALSAWATAPVEPVQYMPCGDQLATHAEDDACVIVPLSAVTP